MSEYLRRYQKAIRMKNFLTKLYIFLSDINELNGGDSYIHKHTQASIYILYIASSRRQKKKMKRNKNLKKSY